MVYQVWTYPVDDVYGETVPGTSPAFKDEETAKEWAIAHAEQSDDYALVLRIKNRLNLVVFDTRDLLDAE